ncbi:hypothetical protein, partial [Megasphaera elsdenii]
MKELKNWTPEPAPRKADLTPFLNRIIQAANDPEVQKVVSRFFRKFISSASKYRNQIYGFSSSFGCSISILNRCS